MEHQAYRCCLPTLAGFAGNHCIGPDSQRRPAGCLPTSPPWRGIRPSYSGLLIQGTANSPSSTTKNHGPAPRAVNLKKLEPMAPNTFGTTYSEYACADSELLRSHSQNWSRWSGSNRRPYSESARTFGVALPTGLNISQKSLNGITTLRCLQVPLRSPSIRQVRALLPTGYDDRQHACRCVDLPACMLMVPTDQMVSRANIIPPISLRPQHIHKCSHGLKNGSRWPRTPSGQPTPNMPVQTRSCSAPTPKTGADGRDRTDDLRFTKPLLYQLSYIGEIRASHYATFPRSRKQIGITGIPARRKTHGASFAA